MKLIDILIGSSLRPSTIRAAVPSAEIYGARLIKVFESRYGFIDVPRSSEQLNLQNGLQFRHGSFRGHVINLEVKQDSIRVISKGGTEICDAAIADMIEVADTATEDVVIEVGHHFKIYETALEVQLDGDFDAFFVSLSRVGKAIGKSIGTYGGPEDPYRGVGISLLGKTDEKGPVSFRFERRAEHPMDSGVYFTTSPLSTPDHLAVLEILEKAIS